MDAALITARFLHFSAAMLLFGTASFALFVAPTSLRERFAGLLRVSETAFVLLALASAIGWLAAETGEAGNGWADAANPAMWAVLAGATSFGQVWIWHLVLAMALALAMLLPQRVRGPAMAAGSGALLASLGLVGHAAMQVGAAGVLHRGSHMLHLVSAGFWVGALPALAVCLNEMRHPNRRSDAGEALLRFSGLGHAAVAIAILSGLVNTALTLGHLPTDLSSPYQRFFALKLALVGGMLLVALTNRYVLTPRLAGGDQLATSRAIMRGTIGEIALGAAVVAVVSAFASWDPS